jgi:hypothetical protein
MRQACVVPAAPRADRTVGIANWHVILSRVGLLINGLVAFVLVFGKGSFFAAFGHILSSTR